MRLWHFALLAVVTVACTQSATPPQPTQDVEGTAVARVVETVLSASPTPEPISTPSPTVVIPRPTLVPTQPPTPTATATSVPTQTPTPTVAVATITPDELVYLRDLSQTSLVSDDIGSRVVETFLSIVELVGGPDSGFAARLAPFMADLESLRDEYVALAVDWGKRAPPEAYRSVHELTVLAYTTRLAAVDLYLAMDADAGTALWVRAAAFEDAALSVFGAVVGVESVQEIWRKFESGTHIVGPQLAPGTYITPNVSGLCYWARLSGFGGTADDVIADASPSGQAVVTIEPTDVGFVSEDCGTWYRLPRPLH